MKSPTPTLQVEVRDASTGRSLAGCSVSGWQHSHVSWGKEKGWNLGTLYTGADGRCVFSNVEGEGGAVKLTFSMDGYETLISPKISPHQDYVSVNLCTTYLPHQLTARARGGVEEAVRATTVFVEHTEFTLRLVGMILLGGGQAAGGRITIETVRSRTEDAQRFYESAKRALRAVYADEYSPSLGGSAKVRLRDAEDALEKKNAQLTNFLMALDAHATMNSRLLAAPPVRPPLGLPEPSRWRPL